HRRQAVSTTQSQRLAHECRHAADVRSKVLVAVRPLDATFIIQVRQIMAPAALLHTTLEELGKAAPREGEFALHPLSLENPVIHVHRASRTAAPTGPCTRRAGESTGCDPAAR